MTIDWEKYFAVAFIDSNVALECLALDQLPWKEIASAGSILVLIAPTVMQEVDSKKSHARLADHARRFNRTLRPIVDGAETVVIREAPAPRVEIAMADCGRIDWTQFDEFDQDEADARVAVQTQCTKGPDIGKRMLLSHDIRPLYLAKKLGLRTYQIGDNWLRAKEQSEAEKKANKLQREVEALKSREPQLEITFLPESASVPSVRVTTLSDIERVELQERIIQLNPIARQDRGGLPGISSHLEFDHTLERRHNFWKEKVVPNYIKDCERKLELNFGQVEIRFRIKNAGHVPAEDLLIRLAASGGWLHERPVVAYPGGPHSPFPRTRDLTSMYAFRRSKAVPVPGRHEFAVIEEPDRSSQIQIACQDFRHGYDHEYVFIGWVDPHSDGLRIDATVTASNLHGNVRGQLQIAPEPTQRAFSELVNLETMRFREEPYAAELLSQELAKNNFNAVDIDGSNWDKHV